MGKKLSYTFLMFNRQILNLIFLFLLSGVYGQKLTILDSGKHISIRGLSAVSDSVVWTSGSSGSVGLSTNGGTSWKWMTVAGYETSDFRDIEAFSEREALIMGVTKPAVILRTTDGGQHWINVYTDRDTSAFLDAMDFNGDSGAAIGDPSRRHILFVQTRDRGRTWIKTPDSGFDLTVPGEAFFAASGSNIIQISGKWAVISGGRASCLYYASKRYPLALTQGGETTGANSIACNPDNNLKIFIAGGDFARDSSSEGNSLLVSLEPFRETRPATPPHGYRSSVIYLDSLHLISCGINGVDISEDGGMNWKLFSKTGFHVCRQSPSKHTVFLAGTRGIIARFNP